jgi:NitT/TauT family transport system permease protein
VGDYFGGTQEALGIQIRASVGIFQLDRAWALIMVASIIGIAFYAAVGLVERRVLSWHASTRSGHE